MIAPLKPSVSIGPLRGIAQSGSAPALGAGCREFESLYPDHFFFSIGTGFTLGLDSGLHSARVPPIREAGRLTAFTPDHLPSPLRPMSYPFSSRYAFDALVKWSECGLIRSDTGKAKNLGQRMLNGVPVSTKPIKFSLLPAIQFAALLICSQ